jgi:hypothetical protein
MSYPIGVISNPNILINTNGKAMINQRGATTVANAQYGFDRWQTFTDGAAAVAQEATGAKTTVTTTGGSGAYLWIQQSLESHQRYAGKTLTFSARIKMNKTGYIIIHDGVESDRVYHSGGGTFETLTVVKTVSASPPYLYAVIVLGNTLAEDDYIEFEWIKLEEGSVATAYQIPDPATELARCQRYFERIGSGIQLAVYGTSSCAGGAVYAVEKRIAPQVSLSTTSITAYQIDIGTATSSGSVITLGAAASTKGINFSLGGWPACWVVDQRHVTLLTDCIDVSAEL